MPLFGRQSTPVAPLTPKERDERDRKAALAEARALVAHERAVQDDLKARAQAAAAPAPVAASQSALLAALDDAAAHGAATLRAQLGELAQPYEVDALLMDYQRQTDALRRAVGNFSPAPPLSARDCDKIAEALRAEINAVVGALVQQVEDATAQASRWLLQQARQVRRTPDDKAADARDGAAFDAVVAAREQPADMTIEPVLDVEEGAHTRLYTLRYHVPREGDYE